MRKVIMKETDAGIQCWCPNCMGKFDKKTNWYAEVCKHCGQHLDWTEVEMLEGSGDGVVEYECDPKKNVNCRKTGCEFNVDLPMVDRHCSHTLHKEYEWDGKSKRYDSYGCPEWMKGE